MIRWTIRFRPSEKHGKMIHLQGHELDANGYETTKVCGVLLTQTDAGDLGVQLIAAASDVDSHYHDTVDVDNPVRCACLDLQPGSQGPHLPTCSQA